VADVGFAQMVENIQRDNLKPLEIAGFVGGQIKSGRKQKDIAKLLGKDATYVNRYANLYEARPWIKELTAQGACSDITTLAELIKLDESGKIDNLQEKVSGLETLSRADLKRLSSPEPKMPKERHEEEPATASAVSAADNAGSSEGMSFDQSEDKIPAVTAADAQGDIEPARQAAHADKGEGGAEYAEGVSKPRKEKEPDLEIAVYIGGRKGYLQTRNVEIWWDDTGEFEKVPLKDLPPDVLEC
jgi:ParB family chromosome partitioning protein